ncbi:hypothetical protein BJ741DRAFT_106784 [Chytriomyces cf. hyalinus JEL632]|nr:hypothetical protein BJ741DRAFT_106784 [Chytriomyces cf. hyalinus JEL632]
MAESPNSNNKGTVFKHFPSYGDWLSQQEGAATIDNYHDALFQHADEIKFKRQYPEDAFAVFQYLARLGHVASMYSYCCCSMYGEGATVDRTGGFASVEKSATLGFAKAQRQLAVCLSKGIGCEQSGVEALRWAQSAIDQGFINAYSTVGTMYFEGLDVPVNRTKAMEHYLLGMDAGSIECISQVGIEMKQDVKMAVELYEKAISLGSSMGCCYLGDLYHNGDDGFPKDPSKAATYYEQAVPLGDDSSAAKQKLAYLYDKGTDVEQNYELSLQYYLEAAKFEDACALYQLGVKYMIGTGVEQDNVKAFEFHERAKQNNAAAITNLGYLFGEGQGCAKDLVRAAQLYQQSAALGNGVGAHNCGVVFRNGLCVEVNLFKALDYYQMAVRLKYDGAKSCLGPDSNISRDLYNTARVLQRHNKDKEALDHFRAAAGQGHSESIAAVYRNAAGLGPVSYETDLRYFEPQKHQTPLFQPCQTNSSFKSFNGFIQRNASFCGTFRAESGRFSKMTVSHDIYSNFSFIFCHPAI